MGFEIRKMVAVVDWEFDWYRYASCRGLSFSLSDQEDNPFFVLGRGRTYSLARQFCSGCPVVVDCLVTALPEGTEGFWGCTSVSNRKVIRRLMKDFDYDFRQATSEVWEYHRIQGSEVPPLSVWKEWE